MDITTARTVIGIVIAAIIGVWQIQLARKQIHISKEAPHNASKLQENPKEIDPSKVQADNYSVAVGKIEIGGDSGNITIGNTYYMTTEGENKYRERPYPYEIFEQLDGLPLLQREQAQNSYLGLRVRWRTTLNRILNEKENFVRLILRDRDDFPAWVHCTVNILEYPELKIAKSGHWMWIEGEITSLDRDRIYLENCKIELD